MTRIERMVLLGLIASAGCISEERPRDATSADTSDVAECVEAARECLDYRQGRVCEGGRWRTAQCQEGQICELGSGQCVAGQYTCLGLLLCYIGCPEGADNNPCSKECTSGATVNTVDQLTALNECQCGEQCWPILCGKLLPWPTYGAISACVAEACPSEGAACIGGGRSGPEDCKTLRDCALACQSDDFCVEQCMARGTEVAQVEATFYLVCVRKECGEVPEPQCLFNAQQGECAQLWDACQAP